MITMLERINLVPQKPFSEKIKKATPFVLCMLVTFLFLVFIFQKTAIERQIVAIDQEISKVYERSQMADKLKVMEAKLSNDVTTLQKLQTELQVTVDSMSPAKDGKFFFSRALAGITQALPASIKCNKISFQDNTGSIEGSAVRYRDLPKLVAILSQNPQFTKVVLQNIDKDLLKDEPQLHNDVFSFRIIFELT